MFAKGTPGEGGGHEDGREEQERGAEEERQLVPSRVGSVTTQQEVRCRHA